MTRFNINWTAKTLMNQMKRGNVNFDNAIQRGLVWDNEKKSLLIHSMIYGYAIPAMYFTRNEDGVYDSLDGKQRSNAIAEFLNDEFALTLDTPPVYDDDGKMDNVGGMYFSQLPEWAKDRVKDFNLTIYYYEGMTEEEIKEFFRRLNNGKPLSSMELTRVSTPCLEKFQKLANHDAIKSIVTKTGKNRFTDEMIAMQLYNFITMENPDFSTKAFREWARNVVVDDVVMNDIRAALDKYLNVVTVIENAEDISSDKYKKFLKTVKTRTHFVTCIYACYLHSGKTVKELAYELMEYFSGEPTISDDYNNTVHAGSAKAAAVTMRKNEIKNMDKYFITVDDVIDDASDDMSDEEVTE